MKARRNTLQMSSSVVVLVLAVSMDMSCAPSVNRISGRTPGLYEKESAKFTGVSRPVEDGKPEKPDIYIRRKGVTIEPVLRENTTGSLYNLSDDRNYLFATTVPTSVGHYLAVDVRSNRGPEPPEKAPAERTGAQQEDAPNQDQMEQELLESLPDLAPGKSGKPRLIRRMKMKVVHRYPNGDVMVSTSRSSNREGRGNEITIQARIPYDHLADGRRLSTEDLFDVNFIESTEGKITERRSSGWEDEYSMRLSGFSEAKSKFALELEEKRRQLAGVRENLESRIKNLGAERRQIAKERERQRKLEGENQRRLAELNEKIQTQETTIAQQQETIEELQPEDKPGDETDGATGE